MEGLSTEARSIYCDKVIPKSVGFSRVVEFVGSAMIIEGIKVVGIVRVIEGIKFSMPRDPASFYRPHKYWRNRTRLDERP